MNKGMNFSSAAVPNSTNFFHLCFFCGEATRKTSIDGLKWRDLVGGRWWLVNFKVSGVTKGFACNTQSSPCKRPRARG